MGNVCGCGEEEIQDDNNKELEDFDDIEREQDEMEDFIGPGDSKIHENMEGGEALNIDDVESVCI